LYEQAQAETDARQRNTLYTRMEKIMIEESPVIVLFQDEHLQLMQANVEGLSTNAINNLSLERVNIRPDVMAEVSK